MGETCGELTAPAEDEGDGTGPVTARLVRRIAEVTGRPAERIVPATSLADLGLDSLTAVRLREAVVREFGAGLSLSELLSAGTVGGVVEAIRGVPHDCGVAACGSHEGVLKVTDTPGAPSGRRTPDAAHLAVVRAVPHPLRPLRPGGDRPALILAHAAGGTPDVYRPLAGLLSEGLPVYGLERVEEAGSVAEKARLYAEAIRRTWPEGRYRIGGRAFGGLVAQETARLLAAGSAAPDTVVLVDAVRPPPRPPGTTEWDVARKHFEGFAEHVRRTYGVRLDLPYRELAGLADRDRIDLVLAVLNTVADVPPATLRHRRASYLDLRAGEAHTPGPYDGRVILYRTTEPAPHTAGDALGWDGLCPDLEIVHVPGRHLCLQAVAAHLDRAL